MGGLVPWQAHLEVWILVLGVLSLGLFFLRIIQPKAVAAGYPKLSIKQKFFFILATVLMWLVSDWPIHEIAETKLYSVHMAQHLMLSMIIPALFLLSVPTWLFKIFFDETKKPWLIIKKLSKPLTAGVIFNAAMLLLHWSWMVQLSADSASVHFGLHVLVFTTGLLMWMPVIGPEKRWHLSSIGKCIYLFAMSLVPTVPSGWLIFAEEVVYRHYDTPDRLWGIDVLADQQAAGVVMKLVGGFFIWAVIVVIFFRWANKEMEKDF